MSFEVITYATHSEGMFDELINSGYPVKVLGWGVKWESFLTKIKGVLDYMKTKNPDDIVVCVDGFDTKINRSPKEAEEIFKKMNCGFLVSEDVYISPIAKDLLQYHFRKCKNGVTANMGLWMGYVKYIIPILEDLLSKKCTDDQINFNSICKKYDYVKIDTDKLIFANKTFSKQDDMAIFHGFPGSGKLSNPLHEKIKHYFKTYFPTQFILISLILLVISIFYKRVIYLLIPLLFIFIFYSNKKCI